MELSKEEVLKIVSLCRIKLSEHEVEKMQRDLSTVLAYVSELNKVDTNNIEEISQVTGLENIFRPDVAEYSEIREAIIKNFPESKDNFLKIKSIL